MVQESLPKATKYFLPKSGRFSAFGLFKIAALSTLGAIIGIALAIGIQELSHKDYFILTIGLVMGGTILGTKWGNETGEPCRNSGMFILSLVPSTLIIVLFSLLYGYISAKYGTGGGVYEIFECIAFIATPFIAYHSLFKEQNYCEDCKARFKNKTLIYSNTASPYLILTYLRNKMPFPSVAELESAVGQPKVPYQRSVMVEANHCPKCNQSVINASVNFTDKNGRDGKAHLFFSEYFVPSLVAEVFPQVPEQQGLPAAASNANIPGLPPQQ